MARRTHRRYYSSGIIYILKDEFYDSLSAGSINNTYATDRKNLRTVIDGNGKLLISGGKLSIFPGGVAAGNPGIWYPSLTRQAGRILLVSTIGNSGEIGFGYNDVQSGYINIHSIDFTPAANCLTLDGWNQAILFSFVGNTPYIFAEILRGSGVFNFVKGGIFTKWTLLWVYGNNSTATLYPGFAGYGSSIESASIDFIRIPTEKWLPKPIASDSFNRGNGTIGVTDGAGHAEANGGSGLAWTNGAISGNAMVIAPTLGSELATGTLTVGIWYQITASQTDHFYTGSAVGDTFRATATTALDANNKVKALTLSTQMASVDSSVTDVLIDCEVSVLTNATQAGLVARLDSASSPANFLLMYFDKISGTVKVVECASGIYTEKLSASITFTASDHLILSVLGTKVICHHITSGGTITIIDTFTTAITTGTLMGGFATDGASKINSFVGWAEGSEGQYDKLNIYSSPGVTISNYVDYSFQVNVTASQTISPKFTFLSYYPVAKIDWGDGTAQSSVTGGSAVNHTYTNAGTYIVSLVMANQHIWVTQIDIRNCGVSGFMWAQALPRMTALTLFYAMTNASLSGGLDVVNLPRGLQYFDLSYTIATMTGDIANLPPGIISFWLLGTRSNLTGVMTNLPATLTSFWTSYTTPGDPQNAYTGTLLTLPSGMTTLAIDATASMITDGDISHLPSTMQVLNLSDVNASCGGSLVFTGGATQLTCIGIRLLAFTNDNLTQAQVDAILARCATDEAITTYATPTLTLTGCAAPSAAGLLNKNALNAAGWVVTTE